MAKCSICGASAPSASAVHAFLRAHGITGKQAARMMYLSDSRQVRKYTGGENRGRWMEPDGFHYTHM